MRAAMVSCLAARYAARSATGMRNALRCIQTSRIPREPRNSRLLAQAVSIANTVPGIHNKYNELRHKVPTVRRNWCDRNGLELERAKGLELKLSYGIREGSRTELA